MLKAFLTGLASLAGYAPSPDPLGGLADDWAAVLGDMQSALDKIKQQRK